jgi:hypothetical protein
VKNSERERTDLAWQRNLLANERTFSAWLRTGLADEPCRLVCYWEGAKIVKKKEDENERKRKSN